MYKYIVQCSTCRNLNDNNQALIVYYIWNGMQKLHSDKLLVLTGLFNADAIKISIDLVRKKEGKLHKGP